MWFPLCEYDYAVWQTAEGRMQGQVQTNREEVMHNEEKRTSLSSRQKRTSMLTGTRFWAVQAKHTHTYTQKKYPKMSQEVDDCIRKNLYLCPRARKMKTIQQPVLSGFWVFLTCSSEYTAVSTVLTQLHTSLIDSTLKDCADTSSVKTTKP